MRIRRVSHSRGPARAITLPQAAAAHTNRQRPYAPLAPRVKTTIRGGMLLPVRLCPKFSGRATTLLPLCAEQPDVAEQRRGDIDVRTLGQCQCPATQSIIFAGAVRNAERAPWINSVRT